MTTITMDQTAALRLLDQFSLEVTGKDLPNLGDIACSVPAGTRVNVTYLAGESMPTRIAVIAEIARLGLQPVPHISARRLASPAALEHDLKQLADIGASGHVFVVGGDPPSPEGPYEDALAVIRSGLLERYGVQEVNISGYPEGHPDIAAGALWNAMDDKLAALADHGLQAGIVTQFGFDVDAFVAWIEAVRSRGVQAPIRIGVPGPTGVKRLLSYAKRFGVGSGSRIARKYGLSLTNLMSTAGPERFVRDLAAAYQPDRHGEIKLHFYTFGGLGATTDWIGQFRDSE